MASAGPSSRALAIDAWMASCSAWGRPAMAASSTASPSFGLKPAAFSAVPCCSNSSGKNAWTAMPNMIGSETFIIVALRCRENSTPWALASAIWVVRNATSARLLMTAPSMISPARTGSSGLRTVTVPSVATCSMRSVSAASRVTEVSLWRKSPLSMVATWVFESADQAPIECGCLRAYSFTERRGSAVRVAFAQHRVHRAALHLVVAGPDVGSSGVAASSGKSGSS